MSWNISNSFRTEDRRMAILLATTLIGTAVGFFIGLLIIIGIQK